MTFREKGNELPPVWKPEKMGDFIEGKYFMKKTNVGENKANLYFIKRQDNDVTSFWGTTVIDDKMDIHANIGDVIRITYLGKVKKYHDYKLEVDDKIK